MKLFILFAAILPLFSADCDNKTAEQDLFAKKWWLTRIYTKEGTREITTRKPFLKFNKEKLSAGGNGSCNSFGSTLAIEKEKVAMTNIFSTKMYCEGVQPIEDLFLGDLAKVNSYEIKDNKLLLYQDKGLLLEFEGEEVSEQ